MRKGSVFAVLVFAVAFFAAPSASEAITITSISVTVGGVTWCDTTSGCLNPIWNLTGGVTLNNPPGQSLVLTQTGTGGLGGAFNFDSSDRGGSGAPVASPCNAANPCPTSMSI